MGLVERSTLKPGTARLFNCTDWISQEFVACAQVLHIEEQLFSPISQNSRRREAAGQAF